MSGTGVQNGERLRLRVGSCAVREVYAWVLCVRAEDADRYEGKNGQTRSASGLCAYCARRIDGL